MSALNDSNRSVLAKNTSYWRIFLNPTTRDSLKRSPNKHSSPDINILDRWVFSFFSVLENLGPDD